MHFGPDFLVLADAPGTELHIESGFGTTCAAARAPPRARPALQWYSGQSFTQRAARGIPRRQPWLYTDIENKKTVKTLKANRNPAKGHPNYTNAMV